MPTDSLRSLEKKLDEKSFLLGVSGLGYVGLPVSIAFFEKNPGLGK